MKKKILLALMVITLSILAFGTFSASASEIIASGDCGENITYTLDDEGNMIISGYGAMYDWETGADVVWYDNMSSIKSVTVSDGITKIGDRAFLRASNLSAVSLPEGLTTIGISAFYECTSVTSISMPNSIVTISDKAFGGCLGLTSITIPNKVKSIGNSAFYDCSSLTEVTIPDSVTSIGARAFGECNNLNSVYIKNIESYLNINFGGDMYSIPTYYATKLYINGKRAQSIVIPDSVTDISDYAFYNIDSIETVTISNKTTNVGYYAFSDCNNLTTVTMGNSVKTIEEKAFEGCNNLTNLTLSNNLTIIGDYAFCNCSGLVNIVIPDSVTKIGSSAFDNCSSLKSVTIPDSVTSLGVSAFGNNDLEAITLGNGITSIPNYAFTCNAIEEIIIPDSCTSIGTNAFWQCNTLKTISLPNSISEIEADAFSGCPITNVNYNGDEDSWNEIYIASSGNEYLKNATRNYYWYVTLYDENGKLYSKTKYEPESVLDLSTVPEKFEHTVKVYTDKECTIEYIADTPITENLELYYKHKLNEYIVKFYDEDGSFIKEFSVGYGLEIPLPENPTKDRTQQYTYTFAGWDGHTDKMVMPNYELEFKATYTATVNQYTYKFLDNDDKILKELKVDYGTTIVAPDKPADKDPWTFDYWEDFEEGSILTDDITFKAVYKYKTYYVTIVGLDKVYDIVYNDAFELETQIPEEEYLFMGYYTEENGKGTRVTDEDGVCIANYNFLTDITVYPYFPHELLNKIKINGEDSTVVGNSDVVKKVYFATDKAASYLLCTIKYPESITLKEIIEKDFVYVSEESKTVTDGYVYQNLICQYTDNLDNLPYNKKVAPFELVFDIPTSTAPQNAEISITSDSILIGDEDYPFDYIINGNLEIAAKPVESIEISGQVEVVLEDGDVVYTAIVTPDWATNTEVKWSVSDETIATVSKDGVLKPLVAGTVTLIATATDGSEVFAEKIITIKEFAKIATLVTDIGQWDKEFDSNLREYTIYVPYDADSISFKPTFTSGRLTINNSLAVNNRFNSVKIPNDSSVIFVRTNASGYANSEYTITIIRYEGTKTIVSEDGSTFVVNPINIEVGKTVILSLYEDGKFVETQAATYEGEKLTFTTDKAYTNANVMVWDDLTNLKPVCNVENVK